MFSSDDQMQDSLELLEETDKLPFPPACQSFPDAFFPENGVGNNSEIVWAKAMCAECPMRAACAEYGLKWEEHGIWGGLTPMDRRLLRRQRKIVLPVDR